MPTAFVSDGEMGPSGERPQGPSGSGFLPVPKRPQVLLVEDDTALARTLRWAVLGRCEVTAVGTAREAEECLGRKWDAFIFDVALPDGCGLGVMRKARAAQPTCIPCQPPDRD